MILSGSLNFLTQWLVIFNLGGDILGLLSFFKPLTSREKLLALYKQKKYQTIPVLPDERSCEKILKNYHNFPSMLVPKEYMQPILGTLLRGDIVLLWWLSLKKNQTNIPQYFLYKYGIDVDRELKKLKQYKYIELVNNKYILTDSGKQILSNHEKIIQEHRAPHKAVSLKDGHVEYNLVQTSKHFKSSGDLVKDQDIGREYERQKDYANAIKAYHSAERLALKDPLFGNSPPPNIYRRLAIIYRKLKDYGSEIKSIQTGIKYYPNTVQFQERLSKAQKLKEVHEHVQK